MNKFLFFMFCITSLNFAIKSEIREINKIKKFETVLSKLPWYDNLGAPNIIDFMKIPKRTFIAKIQKFVMNGLVPLKAHYYTFETNAEAKKIYDGLKAGWCVIWYYMDCN